VRFEDVVGAVQAVAVLPDGRRVLAAGQAPEIVLLDPEAGAVLARFEGHGQGVRGLAVTTDGRRGLLDRRRGPDTQLTGPARVLLAADVGRQAVRG
jgi:hypothetical protein